MRAFVLLAMLAAALLLSGCNPDDGGDATTAGDTPDSGEPGQQVAGTPPGDVEPAEEPVPMVAPSDWPGWLPAYPGGDLQRAELIENEFGTGIGAEMHTGAGLDEVAGFYKGKMDAAGFYLAEQTISPIERFMRYHTAGFVIQIAVIKEEGPTRILLDAAPVEQDDQPNPPLVVKWLNLGELPPGFPDDLLPMHEMTAINSGIIADDGKLAVVDYTSGASIAEIDEYYTEHYTDQGWRKEERSSTETASNFFFFKEGMQITVGIGKYADGNVYVSISYMPEMNQ